MKQNFFCCCCECECRCICFLSTKGQVCAERAWSCWVASGAPDWESSQTFPNSLERGIQETRRSQWSGQVAGSGWGCCLMGVSMVLAAAPRVARAGWQRAFHTFWHVTLETYQFQLTLSAYHSLPNTWTKGDWTRGVVIVDRAGISPGQTSAF